MRLIHRLFLVVLVLGVAAPGLSLGLGARVSPEEIVVVQPKPQTYGTVDDVAHVVQTLSLLPPSSSTTYAINVSGATGISVIGGSAQWWGEVRVPAGSIIDSVELEACDTNAGASLQFGMASGVAPAGAAANVTPVGSTGATPGCAFFSVAPTSTLTVDNFNNNYWLFLAYGTSDSTNMANAFRVYYRLQVSPGPGTATFTDVPTSSPQFQYVEALVAAGITAGCGSGNYCPNNPITRGQMAVFLAKALGLHWAP